MRFRVPLASITAAMVLIGGPNAAIAAGAARPLYYEKQLTKTELEGRTLRELHLMRNWIFARAGNPFRKRWLADYFKGQPWYKPGKAVDERKVSAIDRANAKAIVDYEASLDAAELKRRQTEVLARQKSGKGTAEDAIELRLLSVRFGKWQGGKGDDSGGSPLENPDLLDKQLTAKQLSDLSRRDLRLLRNMVYARRGRAFKSAVLRDYFGNAAWYKPTAQYSDKLLTAVDGRNIRLIKSVETQLGGPMSEKEHGWEYWA